MPEQKVTYRTSDGAEFSDEEAAARHEMLVETEKEYKAARRKYNKALLKTQKTADGQPFRLGTWDEYYWIGPSWYGGWPQLRTVHFYPWSMELDYNDELTIMHREDGEWQEYRISDLYANEANAMEALIAEQEKALLDRVEELEETKRKWRD